MRVKAKTDNRLDRGTQASTNATTTTTTTHKTPKSTPARARVDLVDEKAGAATSTSAPKHGEVNGARAKKSAVHVRTGDVTVANKKKEVTPESNPEWFWNGHKKWKTAPPDVEVVRNDANADGLHGWIEKWRSPTTGTWVHNYTDEWMEKQAGKKYVKAAKLVDRLPDLRAQVERDLRAPGKTGLLALVVAVIDETCIRIGNDDSTQRSKLEVKEGQDAKEDTYGITTMLGGFLSKDGTTFTFKGKSEVDQTHSVTSPKVISLLKALKAKTKDDEPLFAVTDAEVRKYLKPHGFTPHKFRTLHATTMATEILLQWHNDHPRATSDEREASLNDVLKPVQMHLGHENIETTLGSYINPTVVELFVSGVLK